jgi:hypothetical protein
MMHFTQPFWVSIGGIVKRAFEPLKLEKTTHEPLNGVFTKSFDFPIKPGPRKNSVA